MLEHGIDQAAGLRRSLPRRGGAVLPVAGAGEHPECVVRLAQAFADRGSRTTVVSDFEAVVEALACGRPRARLTALRSADAGDGMHRLQTLASRSDVVLVAVDDGRIAGGLTLPAREALVLAGVDAEALATAYARIKALVGLGSIREVCTLFGQGSGGAPARLGHARLARTAARFLGVDLACVGAAPEAPMPHAYRRLADDLADWARGRGETAWRSH